jgi:hypothetical protein
VFETRRWIGGVDEGRREEEGVKEADRSTSAVARLELGGSSWCWWWEGDEEGFVEVMEEATDERRAGGGPLDEDRFRFGWEDEEGMKRVLSGEEGRGWRYGGGETGRGGSSGGGEDERE